MGTVQKLAENLKEGLQVAPSKLRQTVINKLAVGAMIEAQTPNTSELANALPVPTEQQEIREPCRRRNTSHQESARLCANAPTEIVF